MSAPDAALLAALPGLAFQAALLFARLGAAAMVLPGLGEQDVPATIRLSLALALVLLLLPVLGPDLPPAPEPGVATARLVLQEVAIGLWLGGLARIIALALAMAGQLVATLIGLQGLLAGDAEMGGQGTVLSRAFALVAATLVLASGLYAIALRALVESYAVLPAGAPLPAGAAAEAMVAAGAASLGLALRLAAPFVIAAVVLNVALGLLARLAPQVQTFFVAVPGQILAGLALLALIAPPLLAAYAEALRGAFLALPGAG
ncbi:flagellar biosynthetic protein FliR [Falsiroseomonas oryziterrae]|uniref:flagellar biosynthetic protein FliR n=1 Tax=Falsiroseomonas oryziterrae TaxID=2911368 RepID=UPI001F01E7BD|nr:flagellar biosynthetic protein FliR [Roseomonas sp. NPKOSM-4]